MKKIKLALLTDANNFWLNRINRYYDVELSSKPDFVFCNSTTRYECVYRYDCVRIIINGENIRPDFNLFDYAIGFDKTLQFEDRNLYYPLFLDNKEQVQKMLNKHTLPTEEYLSKTEFCNFIVTNSRDADPMRDKLLDIVSSYKHVDSAGRYRNNMPGKQNVVDKYEFQKKYRFSLVPENSSFPGYTTEKIVDAFAAGTIPIYWGDPRIAEQFNRDAFISVFDYPSAEELTARIREIDENEDLYLKMMQSPAVNPTGDVFNMLEDTYLDNYLCHILNQDPNVAIRRINSKYGWGQFAERDCKYFYEMMHHKSITILYRILRHLKL